MNILVVTDALWRTDNGVGNSYSNIFGGIKNVKIANVCCQQGISDNDVSQKCFQISEGSLIANLKNKNIPSGHVEIRTDSNEDNSIKNTSEIFRLIKRSRLQIFFWLRNFIWKFGRWKSDELKTFIDEFAPDIIFAQLQDKIYLNNLVLYIQEYTKKPLMLYAWDDVYTLKQFNLSPLFWIDRFMQRQSIRRLVKKCTTLYTISKEQKEEYEKIFNKHAKILFKGKDFNKEPEKVNLQSPLKIVYTGNLYCGRYKTLKKLCKYIEKTNKENLYVEIYSGTDLSKRQTDALNISKVSRFMGKISENEVQKIQDEADILLHIEPFELKGSLLCRLSFSTKLVDYFYKGKCIFAIGSSICSSMRYLKRHDAAIVAESISDMKNKVNKISSDAHLISEYAQNAYRCGVNYHKLDEIQMGLLKDFEEAINESCTD